VRTPVLTVAALVTLAASAAGCHAAPAGAPPKTPPETATSPRAAEHERDPRGGPDGAARAGDAKTPRVSAIETILRAASPLVSSPKEAKRLLDEARAKAPPAELALLDHAEALAKLALELDAALHEKGSLEEKRTRAEPLLDRLFRGYADLLREARPIYPDDLDKQAMLAATMYTLGQVDRLGEEERTRLKKEAAGWAHELASKFPKAAAPHQLLGSLCTNDDEDLRQCIRHYATCSSLDPSNEACKQERTRLARLYTAPRCATDQIRKDVGVFFGTADKKAGAREVDVLHAKAYLEAKPAFTAADLAFAETLYVRTAASPSGPETEAEEVYLAVKPERQAAFSAWLARPAKGYVVVMRGSKMLAAAPTGSLEDRKGMLLETRADDVCVKTERRSLPEDLRTP
jgi:hypothetical protein